MVPGSNGTSGRARAALRLLATAAAVVVLLAASAEAQTGGYPPLRGAGPSSAVDPLPDIPADDDAQDGVVQKVPAKTQAPLQPQDSPQALSIIGAIVEANLAKPAQICAACTPVILANPAAAADLIDAAKQYPELAEQLALCLSKIQQSMKAANPEGAETIDALVATAPPAFQAAYAVALVPDGTGDDVSGGTGGTDVAAADGGGGADSGGGSSGGGTSGGAAAGGGGTGGSSGGGVGSVGFGGFGGGAIGGGGGGGGTVSPSTP